MHAPQRLKGRTLKKTVLDLLQSENTEEAMAALCALPPRRVVNPLIAFLNSKDERVKWSAVQGLGAVVNGLAGRDIEGARNVMRRLMWSLNDESGGIGWGSPEAMGEILAGAGTLAEEFTSILLSYADERGNYLELEGLQRGLLWGIGRLAKARPRSVRNLSGRLLPYLRSADSGVRGHAAWLAGILSIAEARSSLEGLREDRAEFRFFSGKALETKRVCEVAEEALEGMPP